MLRAFELAPSILINDIGDIFERQNILILGNVRKLGLGHVRLGFGIEAVRAVQAPNIF